MRQRREAPRRPESEAMIDPLPRPRAHESGRVRVREVKPMSESEPTNHGGLNG